MADALPKPKRPTTRLRKISGLARSGDTATDAYQKMPYPQEAAPDRNFEIRPNELPSDRNSIYPDALMPLLHERQRGNNPTTENI